METSDLECDDIKALTTTIDTLSSKYYRNFEVIYRNPKGTYSRPLVDKEPTKFALESEDSTKLKTQIGNLEKKYQGLFEIREIRPSDPIILCSLKHRDRYIVSDMILEYSALNGEYNSLEEIIDRIIILALSEFTDTYKKVFHPSVREFRYTYESHWEYIWKCPKCNHFEDEQFGDTIIPHNSFVYICRKCRFNPDCKWRPVVPDIYGGYIKKTDEDEYGSEKTTILGKLSIKM